MSVFEGLNGGGRCGFREMVMGCWQRIQAATERHHAMRVRDHQAFSISFRACSARECRASRKSHCSARDKRMTQNCLSKSKMTPVTHKVTENLLISRCFLPFVVFFRSRANANHPTNATNTDADMSASRISQQIKTRTKC